MGLALWVLAGRRSVPADERLTSLRSALERAWHWSALRGVELTRRNPRDLLSEAIRELVQHGDDAGPAAAELATLASYHLVRGRTQLLTRSEFGRRGSNNTEPQQIMKQLAKTDGLRQLCQIVLDGRADRDPQVLPDGGFSGSCPPGAISFNVAGALQNAVDASAAVFYLGLKARETPPRRRKCPRRPAQRLSAGARPRPPPHRAACDSLARWAGERDR